MRNGRRGRTLAAVSSAAVVHGPWVQACVRTADSAAGAPQVRVWALVPTDAALEVLERVPRVVRIAYDVDKESGLKRAGD
jgi:hypothetical protein